MDCKIIKNIIFIVLGYLLIKSIVKVDEQFTKSTSLPKNNNIIDYPKYDIIMVDEKAREMVKEARNDSKMRDDINKKMVEFYGELQNNKKLQDSLKFLNLINDNNMPVFISEHPDNLMFNQIKILLITGKISIDN
jgi:predicted secreted protein